MLKEDVAKKTKKQKLLAELHRLNKAATNSNADIPPIKKVDLAPNYSLAKFTIPDTSEASQQPKSDYSYVFKDLRKTLVLTVLAICAQVVLWYVVR